MVPTSLILLLLVVAFVFSALYYFFDSWKLTTNSSRLLSMQFLMMGGGAALIFLTIGVSIFTRGIVWLSWVLLACATGWVVASFRLLRKAWADMQVRDRERDIKRATTSR